MINDTQFVVSPNEDGLRLDAVVVAHFPATTRLLVQRAIAAGDVTVDGKATHKGAKVRAGMSVCAKKLPEANDLRVMPDATMALEILFEDADLAAANKPAGMDVHPLRPEEQGTLANALVARWPELADVGDQPLMAGVAHRIDGEIRRLSKEFGHNLRRTRCARNMWRWFPAQWKKTRAGWKTSWCINRGGVVAWWMRGG
jgi:23S rRNA pseudouridine1911/1915/1917 synthase